MKTATIKIEMDNAAFEGDGRDELARVLRSLAQDIESGSRDKASLYDINGNKVGTFKITGK